MTTTDAKRGDVVLIGFPFVAQGTARQKRRPAVVVQADRYNRRGAAVIIAAITSTRAHTELPCKVTIRKDSPTGRAANLRLDSVVDCQTIATVPKEEIVRRLGSFPSETMKKIDLALQDALGLTASTLQ
jgi:mRNA-degrading endonuclease toxin of MazEF toxin-antitoxin module